MITDLDHKIIDVLSEPPSAKLSADEFRLITNVATILNDAVKNIIRVELREDLIAYMSQDD